MGCSASAPAPSPLALLRQHQEQLHALLEAVSSRVVVPTEPGSLHGVVHLHQPSLELAILRVADSAALVTVRRRTALCAAERMQKAALKQSDVCADAACVTVEQLRCAARACGLLECFLLADSTTALQPASTHCHGGAARQSPPWPPHNDIVTPTASAQIKQLLARLAGPLRLSTAEAATRTVQLCSSLLLLPAQLPRVCVVRDLRSATFCYAARGEYVRSLPVRAGTKVCMVVSNDERWLVVALYSSRQLQVHALLGGELIRCFSYSNSGPSQFNSVCRRLCCCTNGNLLVADASGTLVRLQEYTLDGGLVRFIDWDTDPKLNSRCFPFAVDTHTNSIVVGLRRYGGPSQVVLLDFVSGVVFSQFAGQISERCTGIAFSHDGVQIAVAEWEGKCVSLYTTDGLLVRRVGDGFLSGGANAVVFSSAGEFVVADCNGHRVCVLSADGATLVRSWKTSGAAGGERLVFPMALAAAGSHLYVMCRESARVHVFL